MTAIRYGVRREWLLILPIIAVLLSAAVVSASASSRSTGDIHTFRDSNNVDIPVDDQEDTGTGTLVRTGSGVSANLHTTDLPAGAYTVWWIIFNNPGECATDCNGSDLGNPDVGGSVARATGKVVGPDGKGNFSAHLNVGDTSEALFGPGLTDSLGAEIHMVIRYHGPVVAANMPAQINSVGGGCVGSGGDFEFGCYDPQAVAFPTP